MKLLIISTLSYFVHVCLQGKEDDDSDEDDDDQDDDNEAGDDEDVD